MNMAPFTALSWEIFGRNRSALLVSAAVAAALGIGINIAGWPGKASFLILASFSLLFSSTFGYVDLSPRNPRAGFPRHILVLPVSTWTLALVPILAGAAFLTAFVLLWLRFLMGIQLRLVEQSAIAVAIIAFSCWQQAMSWELIRLRLAKLAVLAVVSGLACLSLASVMSEDNLLLGRIGGVATLLAMMASGYFFAWIAVIRSRRGDAGEPGSPTKRLLTSWASNFGSPRMPELASGTAAQTWYEWRVFGRLAPVCMLFFCTLFLLMHVFHGVRSTPSAIEIGLVLFTFVMVSPLGGSSYAWKNPQVPRAMMTPFFAALPLDDVELAFAKLRMAARSHLLGVAIVLTTIVVIVLISDNNRQIESLWSNLRAQQGTPGASIAVLLLALFTTVATWTAGAFLMARSFYLAVADWKGRWKYFVGLFALLAAVGWLPLGREGMELLAAHALPIALALLAVALFFASLSLRDYGRTSPLAALHGVLAGFIAVTVVSPVLIWQLNLSAQHHWALTCFAIATVLCAMIPILRMPALIGMNRHR